jgi:hypothetical protein
MKYYVQIEDCQNNIEAVVAVEAENKQEAKYKALRALHSEDNLYIVSKEDAISAVEDSGVIPIDEDGEEIDLEDE